jgi:hypothetical protein
MLEVALSHLQSESFGGFGVASIVDCDTSAG